MGTLPVNIDIQTCPPLVNDVREPETGPSSYIQTPFSDEHDLPYFDKSRILDAHGTDKAHDHLVASGEQPGEENASLEISDQALLEAISSSLNLTHSQHDDDERMYAWEERSRGRKPRALGAKFKVKEFEEEVVGPSLDELVDTFEVQHQVGAYDGQLDWERPKRRKRSITPLAQSHTHPVTIGFDPYSTWTSSQESRTRTSSVQTIRATPIHRQPVIDVYTAGAKELIDALDSGRVSCVQILEAYLDQIERYNGILKAITHLAPRREIMRLARACDKQRSFGLVDRNKMPLHGLPVLVKDNIATDEILGMPTTAGSYALLGMPVKKDAFVVKQLRDAGAIIIGKANMSELASYKSANAPDGWSAVGGQTINVYAPHASPGTSSSGNGVALAAGFCALSVATETDGSITLPCLQSCVYGLKPTLGLLSRTGVVPFAPTFDTPGPMAKDVWSVALLMDVMAGADVEDHVSMKVQRPLAGIKYVNSCLKPSFKGLKIGVPRKNFLDIDPWRRSGRDLLSPELSTAFEAALEKMESLGAIITDPAEIPSAVDGSLWEFVHGARTKIVAADCNTYLTKYLQELGGEGECRSVADVIQFNEDHPDLEMPPGYHGQEVLKRCLTAISIDSDEYKSAKEEMRLLAGVRGLDAVMDQYDLDALICVREGCHSLANMVGAPIAAVPLGLLSDNTPIGVYFIGRRGSDQTLIRIMAAWEANFGPRPLPPIAMAE